MALRAGARPRAHREHDHGEPGRDGEHARGHQGDGARTSIDDFGTGYSSLSTLKRFPIDELKIDKSFVQNVPQNEDEAAIVNAIILIGHTLGMTVVAEGVETNEQLAFLEGRRCNTYQGFLRSKPLPPAELAKLLRAER